MSEETSAVVMKAVEALREKMGDADIGSVIRFDIEDEGGVVVDGGSTPPTVAAGDDPADVVLSADAETFQGLMNGDVEPMGAYMSGRLKISGDLTVAMKLSQILK